MITLGALVVLLASQHSADALKTIVQKTPSLDQRVALLEKDIASLKKQLADLNQKVAKQTNAQTTKPAAPQNETLPQLVSKASPAVVSVVISKDVPQLELTYVNPFKDDPQFQGIDIRVPVYKQKGVQKQKVGAGTGFIVTSDGYIVTNKHVVVDETASYTVLLSDGTKKDAKVYYRDPSDDIALIKIEGKAYKTIDLGDSDKIELGQSVVAIGNALGEFDNTISTGVVSGLNRALNASAPGGQVEQLKNIIQTSAAINPGNSGGPLLDMSGKAIGVNVATVSGSQNIGFSIPINSIRNVLSRALGKD